MRLIDADALIDSLNIRSVTYNCIINKCIEDAPTIDAVDVVRCKGCRYREPEGEITHFYWCRINEYWCRINERPVDDDDFCAWAERKEDGEA